MYCQRFTTLSKQGLLSFTKSTHTGLRNHPVLERLGLPNLGYVRPRTTTTMATTTGDNQNTKIIPPASKIYTVSPTELVTKQRLNRPNSPSLTIYSWEIMICGALHRNTAILLSGTMYLFGFSYFALPLFGLPFGGVEVVNWFGNLPVAISSVVKWIYGFALSFHFAHGIRHLVWDTGAMLTNAQVRRTGIAALAIGALAATGLCFV